MPASPVAWGRRPAGALAARPGLAEVRKHLQSALERLGGVVPESMPVQDDYSFRCAPQVIGAASQYPA